LTTVSAQPDDQVHIVYEKLLLQDLSMHFWRQVLHHLRQMVLLQQIMKQMAQLRTGLMIGTAKLQVHQGRGRHS